MQKISELLAFINAAPESQNIFWHFIEQNYVSADQGKTEIARYQHVLETHQNKFGDGPAAILRAPGRVELLGAHTDYNGCPVIAAAINRDVVVVVSPRDDRRICVQNVRRRYAMREFDIASVIPPFETGDWGNYIKAAVQGMLDFPTLGGKVDAFSGFNMTVSGKIPAAAGLSSSSALVVVSALAFLHVNGIEIEKLKLAQQLAQAEKYVGTQGGGMDQTISLMGVAGKALQIDFNPYAAAEISLPDDFQIVVAHSLVYAPKTKSAMDKFNRRAIECRLATALIKKHFERELEQEFPIALIGDLTESKTGQKSGKNFACAGMAVYSRSRLTDLDYGSGFAIFSRNGNGSNRRRPALMMAI
jgi:galactokinase